MQKFGTLAALFLVEKEGTQKEEEERRPITPLKVSTTCMPAAQGQHTHSAWTNIPPASIQTLILFVHSHYF